jgi:glycosyltransferase involved in cell wall biosynthesis
MVTDLRRTRRCLRETTAPIFHLTAQKYRGIYREWLQFEMARRAGRRFVLDVRAGSLVEAYEDRSTPLRRRLLADMLRRADAITVEGKPYIEWIARVFGREALWFPNFVQLRHRDMFPRAPLERPGPGAPYRVVYAGRLIANKGLEELVRACGRLERERGVPVCLHLAGPGEGDFEPVLRRLAQTVGPAETVFTGRMDHADLLRLLATNHVFAFPTRWRGEGHSNAVNEAMQVGLPIVTTDQGFLPDVVTDACGIRVPRGDDRALEDALAELLGDWDRLRACGHAARERVYAEFSDEVVLRRLAGLYRTLLGPEGDAGRSQ